MGTSCVPPVARHPSGVVTDQPPLPGPWAALPAEPSQLVRAESMTHPARVSESVGRTISNHSFSVHAPQAHWLLSDA